ncbi:hypothetical protein BHM03_00007526 [Ensete ventricosum]|nr:hypothetical protein BHM03_00007526 [Ensete ventricosum]
MLIPIRVNGKYIAALVGSIEPTNATDRTRVKSLVRSTVLNRALARIARRLGSGERPGGASLKRAAWLLLAAVTHPHDLAALAACRQPCDRQRSVQPQPRDHLSAIVESGAVLCSSSVFRCHSLSAAATNHRLYPPTPVTSHHYHPSLTPASFSSLVAVVFPIFPTQATATSAASPHCYLSSLPLAEPRCRSPRQTPLPRRCPVALLPSLSQQPPAPAILAAASSSPAAPLLPAAPTCRRCLSPQSQPHLPRSRIDVPCRSPHRCQPSLSPLADADNLIVVKSYYIYDICL